MDFNIHERKNVMGMAQLMSNNDNSNEILELEKKIISGADIDIEQEQEYDIKEYQRSMERLEQNYNMNDFSSSKRDEPMESSDFNNSNNYDHNISSSAKRSESYDIDIEDDQLNYMTREQKKQSYVDNVLRDIDDDNNADIEFDIDKEKDEDDKNALLDQIDQIRDTLEDDGVLLTNVPIVTKNNSISDIKNVHKILRIKNDRNRYCSFAEEMILAGAHGIEYLFDGKNEWFGRKPDLIGWSNTVRIKLRRCRFETSTLIKEVMSDYNMGPAMRLILELVPSMFLYSRQKKLATTEQSDDDYNAAISNLNSME